MEKQREAMSVTDFFKKKGAEKICPLILSLALWKETNNPSNRQRTNFKTYTVI